MPSRIMQPPRMYVTYVKFPRKMVFPSKEATPDDDAEDAEGAEATRTKARYEKGLVLM
jgi:hypothetical protein